MLHDAIMTTDKKRHSKQVKTVSASQSAKSETTFEFIAHFVERGGFEFIANYFIRVEKDKLETSTLKNKTLTMLIEILSQLMTSKGTENMRNRMNQQLIYDMFFQNLLVVQNFI